MSINLRTSAHSGGTGNTYDQTVNFVSTYGGVSGGSQATNSTALSAFNTAYAAFTGHTQLIIPPGDYNFTTTSNLNVIGFLGGTKLTISAYGATLRNAGGIANAGQFNSNTHQAFINTATAGTSTVTLVTAGQTSRFTAGKYVIVSSIDLQGSGYPTNPGIFEFKKIASIGSGTLTFTEPLTYSYKSTYPEYNAGGANQVPLGGPAIVYALQDEWDQEVTLKGATIADTGGLYYGKTRVARYVDCTFETYGPCPTVNMLFQMIRCTSTGAGGIEVDKIVQRAEFIDSAIWGADFQSSSMNELSVRGTSAASYWRGVAGGNSVIYGLNTPEFRFGVTSYGVVTGHTLVQNCNSANATFSTGYVFNLSDYTEEGGGIISIAGGPLAWAVPGGYFYLASGTDPNAFAASYQVTDVTSSAGRTYITTTLPFPVPGTINGKTAPFKIRPHPGANVTAISCTGSTLFTNQSALPAHSPLFGWSL